MGGLVDHSAAARKGWETRRRRDAERRWEFINSWCDDNLAPLIRPMTELLSRG